MKKNSTSSSASTTPSKIDPTFLPKARILIKKIKAKLGELKSGPVKKSAPKQKKLAKRVRRTKPASKPAAR